MRSAVFLLSLFLIAGCGRDSGSSSSSPSPTPQSPAPKTRTDNQGSNEPQELKVYEGGNPALNKIQLVNVTQGQANFDFTYQPQQDEALTLTSVKSYLIGCKDSDIGIGFDLFHAGPDGKINFSAYDQLGPAPTLVKRGLQYLVRVNLTIRKSCLGMAYNFGVQVSR